MPRRTRLLTLTLACAQAACALPGFVTRPATLAGMTPILQKGAVDFTSEPDLVAAEAALAANMRLIESVAAEYPDERAPQVLAAMARANYAYGFVVDELEAVRLAYPGDKARAAPLAARAVAHFRRGQGFAERALRAADGFVERLGGKSLEEVEPETLKAALEALGKDDAPALFWLAFNWGGRLQVSLDPAEATQLPKIEAMAARVLALDEGFFFGLGPHLLAGTLDGFRAPAIGGQPDRARAHFARATELSGGALLPRVTEAQLVHAQTEADGAFFEALTQALAAPIAPERALLDTLAQVKACRLWANASELFLTEDRPLPERCAELPRKHPYKPD